MGQSGKHGTDWLPMAKTDLRDVTWPTDCMKYQIPQKGYGKRWAFDTIVRMSLAERRGYSVVGKATAHVASILCEHQFESQLLYF